MYALLVIDAQNEFSDGGQRPVPNFAPAVTRIQERVAQARAEDCPIAWIRHFNRPQEPKAFVPGTWGAEYFANLGPAPGRALEEEFQKSLYGAFASTDVGLWLKGHQIQSVLLVGFYTHAAVSTTAREAIMMDFDVFIDASGTGACDLSDARLGRLPAAEVHRAALLHLAGMGATVVRDADEPNLWSKVVRLRLVPAGEGGRRRRT